MFNNCPSVEKNVLIYMPVSTCHLETTMLFNPYSLYGQCQATNVTLLNMVLGRNVYNLLLKKKKKKNLTAPMAYGSSQARGELGLQLLAYATATATPDLSHICNICHSLWQRRILIPQDEARDQTRILTEDP